MKPIPTLLASGLAVAGLALSAPTPPPSKPDDKQALQRAIEAVDGARKAADSGAAKGAPALPPAKPAEQPPAGSAKPERPPKEAPASANPAPKTSKAPKAEPSRTKITSEEDGVFKNKEGIALFRRNVFVDRPDLKIWCDELEVTLNRPEAKKPSDAPAPKVDAPKDDESDDAFSAKNMKKAVATAGGGSVVVIWRKTEKGEMVANCHEAVYDGATGDIVLKGRPEVLQGLQKYIFGKDDEATVTMLKNGDAKGRVGLEFVQEAKGREYRRRLLSSLPSKRTSDIESATHEGAANKATPSLLPDSSPPAKTN